MNRIPFFSCLMASLLLLSSTLAYGQQSEVMTEVDVQSILTDVAAESEHEPGMSTIHFGERWILILTDEDLDRLRVLTPIQERATIGAEEMERMLVANFSTALDAKYSFYDQYVVSTYSHPLGSLSKGQIVDALEQVVMLARTFGTTYSSAAIDGAEASVNKP
ncbi:MAG: hypothetical protein AAFU60_00800 [Bacteroidota bacterium]